MPADPKLSLREDHPETTEAELLARVRMEFGELLKFTPPVRLENYLSNLPVPQRLVALPTLLELDLAWAYDWGQPRPSCDDYVARLPEFKEAVRSFFAQLDSRKGLDDHEDTGELPPPDETLRWRRGLRLGSYELLDALGQGGFGEVWKGRNHNDGSLVAIKSVGPTRRSGSLKSLETITKHNNSLAREREILRELSELDLRVPKLLDEGQDGSGRPYIVMELVPGHDLQHQRERGDWSWRRCVLVTLSIAEALRDLHMQGYYHCDLKTRNIMLDAKDRAWLIDMGSTMRYDDVVQQGIGYYPPFTHGYAPPEAEASDDATQITARYDLHMLGAVLYVLLTGRPPGPDETRLRDKYNDHREQLTPQPPSEIHPRLPGVIDDVCLWMLKKSSQSRPRNAQEVIDRLERVLEEDSAEGGWARGDLPGGSVNDPQIATHAGHASSTAKEPASSDSQPVGLLDVPRAPAIPPPAPPAGGGPRRLALAGAGGTLSVLLALALSIGGRETDPARAAASAGHTVLFELGPMVASVQGQFAPPSLKRTDAEVFEAQAGYPYQVMVGTATETERKYAIDFEFDVVGPVIDVGITFAPFHNLEPHANTTWWMVHLDRQPSDSTRLPDIDWTVRFDKYALTNPIPQEFAERVAEGTLIVAGAEARPLGNVRVAQRGPSFRVTLFVAEGRLIEAHVNGQVFALAMPEEAPLFEGELSVLLAGSAEVPDENGRPRPPGIVQIRKPRFRYVD